jgi:hypothetical protein
VSDDLDISEFDLAHFFSKSKHPTEMPNPHYRLLVHLLWDIIFKDPSSSSSSSLGGVNLQKIFQKTCANAAKINYRDPSTYFLQTYNRDILDYAREANHRLSKRQRIDTIKFLMIKKEFFFFTNII